MVATCTLSVADLHTFVVETRTFREASHNKGVLPFESLTAEVEPNRHSSRVDLVFHRNSVCITGYIVDSGDVSALEVALESGISDSDDSASFRFVWLFMIIVCIQELFFAT